MTLLYQVQFSRKGGLAECKGEYSGSRSFLIEDAGTKPSHDALLPGFLKIGSLAECWKNTQGSRNHCYKSTSFLNTDLRSLSVSFLTSVSVTNLYHQYLIPFFSLIRDDKTNTWELQGYIQACPKEEKDEMERVRVIVFMCSNWWTDSCNRRVRKDPALANTPPPWMETPAQVLNTPAPVSSTSAPVLRTPAPQDQTEVFD